MNTNQGPQPRSQHYGVTCFKCVKRGNICRDCRLPDSDKYIVLRKQCERISEIFDIHELIYSLGKLPTDQENEPIQTEELRNICDLKECETL